MAGLQRKEQATTKQKASASATKDQTLEENMDFDGGNKDLVSQDNQDKDEVVEEHSMDGFSGDWAADTVKSSEDPLYKTQLAIKQKIRIDCNLNSQQELDNSDEGEDDTVPHGKRAPSYTPVKAPPSKLSKPSSIEYDDSVEYSDGEGFLASPPPHHLRH